MVTATGYSPFWLGGLTLSGRRRQIKLVERSKDPPDPVEGEAVIWQSNGDDSGDAGDIMAKITNGGVTSTTTLVDFSAL